MSKSNAAMATTENFEELLNEFFGEGESDSFQGKVVKGIVVAKTDDFVMVDVGLKSEGRIELNEFGAAEKDLEIGSEVEVFVERLENSDGEVGLSRERARREEVWVELEQSHAKEEQVTGTIFQRVKGGFMVDVSGAIAFLPSSQADIRPIRDLSALMNQPQPFMILKMDKKRGNIVVSRRAILEESRAELRDELMQDMKEGLVTEGIVKNLTDYGAFIDLGGIDGLLHLTDMSWKRINHPSEILSVGQTINVQVIKYNKENGRVSLGMKQLEEDPWSTAAASYTDGTKVTGKVTNLTEYGAFIELDEGVEGLIHVSEMSWTDKNVTPSKLLSVGQEVDVMVLEVDSEKRRISLGLKQVSDNPWNDFADNNPIGTTLKGQIKNIADFGLFVEMAEGMDGMVHMSDLSWDKSGEEALKEYEKGQEIEVKILDIDLAKERVSLGVKQLTQDPVGDAMGKVKKNAIVTCTVTAVVDGGVEVETSEGLKGFIKRNDLSRDRSEQRPDRFAKGEKLDAKVIQLDKGGRKVNLSIKAREIDEEKQAMQDYGSADSGAQLGDILGGVLAQAKGDQKDAEEKSEDKPKKKAAAKKAPAKKAAKAEDAEAEAADEKAPKKADSKKAESKDEPKEETKDAE